MRKHLPTILSRQTETKPEKKQGMESEEGDGAEEEGETDDQGTDS